MSTDDEFADSGIADEEDEDDVGGEGCDSVAYELDEFDEYSNAFESAGGGDESADGATASSRALLVPGAAAASRFASGDRVQVIWADENEWFDGNVTRVDDAASPRAYHVQYNDGEAAWETGERMRYAPVVFGFDAQGFQQLQLLLELPSMRLIDGGGDAAASLLRASVLVYWADSASWFAGSVVNVDTSARALQVEYEDGDLRWEQERDFASVLVHVPDRSALTRPSDAAPETPVQTEQLVLTPASQLQPTRQTLLSPPPPPPAPVHQPERVLVPRAYKAVASDHFRPELTPRPYTSVTSTIGSIVTARSAYSERRYLHTKLECTASATRASEHGGSRDCLVQTEIPAGASSDADTADSTRCVAGPC